LSALAGALVRSQGARYAEGIDLEPVMTALPHSVLIVTDAWHAQINGVVRSIESTGEQLRARGIEVHYLTPRDYRTVPMPGYPEIALSMTLAAPVEQRIDALRPHAIHIATEGPLGLIARRYCVRR